MRLLQSTTQSNKDITSDYLAATYTADAVRAILIRVVLDQVAGSGDYSAYVTLQELGTGSAYKTHVATLTAAVGVTSLMFPSILLAVNNTDVVNVYVKGLAGDSATPDVITRFFALSYLSPTTPDQTLDVPVLANLTQILGSAITGTAAQLSAAWSGFWNKAAPTGNVNSLPDAVPGASGGLPRVSDVPTVEEIDTQLTTSHGDGSWLSGAGSGSVSQPIVVNDENGDPLDGVLVSVYTDTAKSVLVASGYTDAFGLVTFELDPGTYYVWRQLLGYNFGNPSTLVVS